MKTVFVTVYVFFLFPTALLAQAPFFQAYSLLKKNEPVGINVIYQDKTGFIWFGTNRGLFKFDGLKFRHFGKEDGLPDENVTALSEDSLRRIWIGHKNGGLVYLEKNKIQKFETAEGPVKQEISRILFDKQGTLWFSTLNEGLWYYRKDRLNQVDEGNGMPDLYVYDIAEAPDGKIWAGTDGGLAICTLRDTVSVKVLDYRHGMPDNIIKKVTILKDGQVWLATDNSGIIKLDPLTGEYKPLVKGGWHHGPITDFLIDGNQVWIAATQTGLIEYDQVRNESRVYKSKENAGITAINTLLKDIEGNIWAGTSIGVLRTLGDYIEYIQTTWQSAEVSVVAVTVEEDGTVWWAGKEGLFKRSVLESGDVVVEKQLVHTPYEKFTITSLYVDTTGHVWAGFYGEGALRIDPVTGKMRHFRTELRNGNVLNITGKGNVIWLATLEGATQIILTGDKTSIKSYSSRDGLSSDYIYQAFIDSQDQVWFATDGKGADMRNASGFHHFEDGLNSKIIYGFAEDRNHHIWANVASEGLFFLDGTTFKPLPPDKGLRDNSISCLNTTRKGNLIVMHDQGIDIYDTRRDKIRYQGDEGGMHDKLPNLNATARDLQGRIYIGTSGGIVVYSVLRNRLDPIPIALIADVKVMDQTIDFSSPVNLPHDRNFITLDFLGIWYQNPDNLFYQIKLENYDREWIPRRDHSATYSNLPPGDYVFRLRVSDTIDFSNVNEATVKFTIAPPFWSTAWFYILSSTLVGGMAYLLIKKRERKLLEDKHFLEEKVKERTLEIQRKTEEIQAQNEEIHSQAEEIKGINENLELLVKERTLELVKKNRALEEYAFITAHNLRAPVASVLGLINLASKMDVDEESKILIEHLKASAEKLDDIVRSITQAIEKGE
jgi:ligand-binding sensor domain-containing protein